MPLDRRLWTRTASPPPSQLTTTRSTATEHTDGLNDADEMNLYVPNPQADSPFGPADLEWLYRQQDVDGSSLVSRLAQLAPVSFTNPIDGQRRRRLFTTDSWEMNNFAWANDNPGNAFPNNQQLRVQHANAGFPVTSGASSRPVVPNPVSGPARQEDQPQLPAAGLQRPRRADPPEVDQRRLSTDEVRAAAEGGRYARRAGRAQPVPRQRDRLPRPRLHDDPLPEPGREGGSRHDRRRHRLTTRPTWPRSAQPIPATSTAIPLDQYGMEYNPIAINEALAYSFQSSGGSPRPTASSSSWSTPCPSRPSGCCRPTTLVPASPTRRMSRCSTCRWPITTW